MAGLKHLADLVRQSGLRARDSVVPAAPKGLTCTGNLTISRALAGKSRLLIFSTVPIKGAQFEAVKNRNAGKPGPKDAG